MPYGYWGTIKRAITGTLSGTRRRIRLRPGTRFRYIDYVYISDRIELEDGRQVWVGQRDLWQATDDHAWAPAVEVGQRRTRSSYPREGGALRWDDRYGTVLEPVTVLGVGRDGRGYRVRFRDGEVRNMPADYVSFDVNWGRQRRRGGSLAALRSPRLSRRR